MRFKRQYLALSRQLVLANMALHIVDFTEDFAAFLVLSEQDSLWYRTEYLLEFVSLLLKCHPCSKQPLKRHSDIVCDHKVDQP